ncbi:hypothetical protein DSO57_1029615 [Entomophthora muscae]|uniref:Uncharacterized protein n=1 Tax=Entomophthora muscae TaxID=34485 RepID=A0ACC2SQH6_9FUNG|nr:hypothetical protein DSO57_1029615 [Entomophthora muscae]
MPFRGKHKDWAIPALFAQTVSQGFSAQPNPPQKTPTIYESQAAAPLKIPLAVALRSLCWQSNGKPSRKATQNLWPKNLPPLRWENLPEAHISPGMVLIRGPFTSAPRLKDKHLNSGHAPLAYQTALDVFITGYLTPLW